MPLSAILIHVRSLFVVLACCFICAACQQTNSTQEAFEQQLDEDQFLAYNNFGPELIQNDFNADGLIDLLGITSNEEFSSEQKYWAVSRMQFHLLLGKENGAFEKRWMTDTLMPESLQYMGQLSLTMRSETLVYVHQSMRHDLELFYLFDKQQNDLVLVEKKYVSYDSPPYVITVDYLKGTRSRNGETKPFPKTAQTMASLNEESMYADIFEQ